MAIKKAILFLLMLSAFSACEERVELNIPAEETNVIAVEAVVTNENINHILRLSLPYQQLNGRSVPVKGAQVNISDGTSSVLLVEADSGRYVTPKMRFVTGNLYVLTINYQGNQYTAQHQSVPVEPLPPLSYYNAGGGYRFNFFDTGTQANYVEYQIDWRNTPSCTNLCNAKIIYYDLKTVDSNEIFKPSKSNFIIPPQSIVIRRKFSVNEDYRSYLRSMLSETEWRGSLFDVQRDNPPTNLSKGAIGFFAVSTVVSDTVKIQ
jgi:hypothetical protein